MSNKTVRFSVHGWPDTFPKRPDINPNKPLGVATLYELGRLGKMLGHVRLD